MSQENLDLVQAALAAYFQSNEQALRELTASDITVTTNPDQPDFREYHGFKGLLQVLGDWTDTWDDYSFEVTRMRGVGDFVLVVARQRGQGKRSGVPIDDELTFVFNARGGKILRLQMFAAEQEALRAVGLEE
jgi:uncharacterized protein